MALLILIINAFVDPDLTTEQVGVISVVALPVFSYIQNMLEETGTVPEMLKGPPVLPAADALTALEIALIREALPVVRQPERVSTEQAAAPPRAFRG